MSNWTSKEITKRILDEVTGLLGEDVRERQEAIVMTWLETLQRQEGERLAAMFEKDARIMPLGQEDPQKGKAIYNWLMYAARKIRDSQK